MSTPDRPDRTEARAHFADNVVALTALDAVADAIDACGPSDLRVARTQVGWARRRGFVTLWDPRQWLDGRGAPAVVSVALPAPDHSSAWKQVVEARPDLWQHHREIHRAADLDDSLANAIRASYQAAG